MHEESPYYVFVLFLGVFLNASLGLDCPNGFVTHGSSCYVYLHESYTWFEGETACRSMEARMVEIDSAEENKFVVELARSHGASNVWTGANDFAEEGVFVNPSSYTRVPSSFWDVNQPDDAGGTQDCLYIRVYNALWDDAQCTYQSPVVCEMPLGDHEFPIVG